MCCGALAIQEQLENNTGQQIYEYFTGHWFEDEERGQKYNG
jgi:hypothetical protein